MSNIFFAINDITKRQGPSPLNIEGTYTVGAETIKIEAIGGPAVIEFNETDDWLRMKNARITSSTAPIDNVKFSFWRTFATLRTTGSVTYSVSGSGVFRRSIVSTDPIDWVAARGYVEGTVLGSGPPENLPPTPLNPPTCNHKLTCCATHLPGSWIFDLTSPNTGFKVSHNFTSLPPGSNDLKAAFWIHLEKNTDRLDITAAPGIRVKFGTPSAMPGPVAHKGKKGKIAPKP